MEAPQAASAPWHKTCSRCKKATFEDLLDEQGVCDYCREIVAMRGSSRGNQGERQVKNRFM